MDTDGIDVHREIAFFVFGYSRFALVDPFSKEHFLEALVQVVRTNVAWVPPYGSGVTPA